LQGHGLEGEALLCVLLPSHDFCDPFGGVNRFISAHLILYSPASEGKICTHSENMYKTARTVEI
jgi:hypothetical protein